MGECRDCKAFGIPLGYAGAVFLVCEDRFGSFTLCSRCKRARTDMDDRIAEERRRALVAKEARVHGKKKKASKRPGGQNRAGPSH